MPRSATTGVYTRVSNSFSHPVAGTVIDPDDATSLFTDQDGTGFNNLPVKMSDRSVTNPTYGATGNGVTDDTAAIQAALNALAPGIISLPTGTYSCTHIDVPSGVTIVGDGYGKTIIKCRSAPAAGTDWWYANTLTNVEIRGITFDGNGMLTNPAGGHYGTILPCIYFVGGSRINIHHCEFIGWATAGLLTNTAYDIQVFSNIFTRATASRTESYAILMGGTGTIDANNLRNFVIDGNRCTNGNISVSGHDGSITNNVVTGWGFSAGINTQALASNYNLYIGGNKCYTSNQNTDQPGGYFPAGIENWASTSIAEGNDCSGNYGSGIDWGGANGVITGNNCWNNGAGTSSGGITLHAQDATFNASGTIVQGNRCTDTRAGGARTQAYGLLEQANVGTFASNIPIGINDFEGNLTSQMSLQNITRASSMAALTTLATGFGFIGGVHNQATFQNTRQLALDFASTGFGLELRNGTITGNRVWTLTGDANRVVTVNGDITFGGNVTFTGSATLPTIALGDIWYGSATSVISALAKDTNATRYLSNQGASNIPSWNQINLANGVTGVLPPANGGTGINNNPYNITLGGGLTTGAAFVTVGGSTLTLTTTGGTNVTLPTSGTLYAKHPLQVNLSASQTPTSGVKTKINFNTEVLDPDSWYDNATNFRYTPQVAGNYLVNVQVSVSGTTVSNIALAMIYKNGAEYAEGVGIPSATNGASTCVAIVAMNGTTDYIEGWGRVTAGGSPSFDGGTAPIFTWMSITYIGP